MLRIHVKDPTSKYFGFRQSYGMVKLAKRTVLLHPVLNAKNLDVEQLTLNTISNTLIQIKC